MLCHHKWKIMLSEKRNFQKTGIINYIKESFTYKTKFLCIKCIWKIQVNLTKFASRWWDGGMEETVVHIYLSLLPCNSWIFLTVSRHFRGVPPRCLTTSWMYNSLVLSFLVGDQLASNSCPQRLPSTDKPCHSI